MLYAFMEIYCVTQKSGQLKSTQFMLGAQLKGKFIAYVRTLWQLENYIQNKNNFIKVVTVPKLWSPNHILEVIFQMPEAVVSLWEVHSCQILGRVLQSYHLFSLKSVEFWLLSGLRGKCPTTTTTAGKKERTLVNSFVL